jgi:hypothetical protein
MDSDSLFSRLPVSRPNPGELMTDYRTRLAHEHALALERRESELAEQVSIRNAPDERIRIWERMHGLTLPRDPSHRLLAVVAVATHLALEQVLAEQQRRLTGAPLAPAADAP